MIISMDLNASPLPEEDEEENIVEHVEEVTEEERIETAVETLRREREERRRRLKREHPDEDRRAVESSKNDSFVQVKYSRSYEKSKLPAGWLDCPGHGNVIGCIIPSKVPLGEHFSDAIVPGKRYSLRQVIHQQRALGRELGMVVDLTNTTRYYSPSDYKRQGIKHVKIPCKGRDAVPDNESVNIFVYEVMQFLSRQKHSRKFVLVHCTHGHNRTGFMIINFLMRTKPFSVTQALHVFSKSRPPGIYKEDYIDALYKFYHEERPDTIICPPTPEWKRSSDFDLNGEAIQDEDDFGGIEDPFHEKVMENEVMTIDDVLGDAIPYDQQETMRQFCLLSLKMPASKGNQQFPGSHPVSLDRDNLQLLRQRYYYATWKADGTRYMMLIMCDGCYLIDRTFSFRRVQMRFPLKLSTEAPYDRTHNFTLLDGEMVIDTLPTNKLARRYLIYDLMVLNGHPVNELPFSERWKLIEKEVVEPRNQERQIEKSRNLHYKYDMEPFRVRRKDFYLLCTVTKLLKEFIPKLSHAADGLIFQGWDDPYVPRTHEGLLKWKYPEMNSIDFLFEVGDDDRQRLYIFQRGKKKLLEGKRVIFKGESDLSIYSGKIIECNWDWEEECWACMRIRTDKETPNDINTYRKVMKSITDNITEEVVLQEIQEIVSLPMYADRINSDKRGHGRRR